MMEPQQDYRAGAEETAPPALTFGEWSMSTTIHELAAALAKAQGQVRDAAKDSTNPHFRSRYADLASVWDACREALTANGIAIIQMPARAGNEVALTTLMTHASGQWISSRLTTPVAQQNAQGIGGGLTYLRRYALAAMVGVAPDDDDGETAVGRGASPQQRAPATQPSAAKNRDLVREDIRTATGANGHHPERDPFVITVPATADGAGSDWAAWGKLVADKIAQTTGNADLDRLLEANTDALTRLGQEQPKWHKALEVRATQQRNIFRGMQP